MFFVESVDKLKPGDVLLFCADVDPNAIQSAIVATQKAISYLKPERHQFANLTHAAIFVGYKENKKFSPTPIISHYRPQPTVEPMDEVYINRPFIVFRFNDEKLAHKLSRIASDIPQDTSFSIINLFRAAMPGSELPEGENEAIEEFKQSSICVQFAITCIDKAMKQTLGTKEYQKTKLNLDPLSTPMTMATILSKLPEEQISVGRFTAGQDPYQKVKQAIYVEIDKMESLMTKKASATEKFSSEFFEIKKFKKKIGDLIDQLDKNNDIDPLAKYDLLMKELEDFAGTKLNGGTVRSLIEKEANAMGMSLSPISELKLNKAAIPQKPKKQIQIE